MPLWIYLQRPSSLQSTKTLFFFLSFFFFGLKKDKYQWNTQCLKASLHNRCNREGGIFSHPPPPSLIMPAMHTRLVKANLSPFQEPLMLVGSIHQLFSKYFCFFCELPCKAVQLFQVLGLLFLLVFKYGDSETRPYSFKLTTQHNLHKSHIIQQIPHLQFNKNSKFDGK